MEAELVTRGDAIGTSLILLVLVLLLAGLLFLQKCTEGGLEGFAREYHQKNMDKKNYRDPYQRDLWIMLALITGFCLSNWFLTAIATLVLLLVMLRVEKYMRSILKRMLVEKTGG